MTARISSSDRNPPYLQKFGWKRGTRDVSHLRLQMTPHPMLGAVSKVDLRANCPPVYDQGTLSSCTANAVAAAYSYKNNNELYPSRLFLYYDERALEGSIGTDDGAVLEDGFISLVKTGVCSESTWPYVASQFAVQPPAAAFDEASQHKIGSYASVAGQIDDLKSCLLNNQPLSFGFVVYTSFMTIGANGIMSMPRPGEAQIGGHAVLMVGYDDDTQMFLVRNSWGSAWGWEGYFWMPYAYALNPDLAGDYFVITA